MSTIPLYRRPDRDKIIDEAAKSRDFAGVAERYGLQRAAVRMAVVRHEKSGVPLNVTVTDDGPTVTGGWDADGSGVFRWSNIKGDIPSDAEIRFAIAYSGQNPDDYTWRIAKMGFKPNVTVWQRDQDIARDPASVAHKNSSAYTTTANTGWVEMAIDPKPSVIAARQFGDLRSMPKRPKLTRPKKAGRRVRHVVIPDTQVKPGDPTEHLRWAGQYIADTHKDEVLTRVVHLGDHWDMMSLSHWDAGKLAAEGRRVNEDLDAGEESFVELDEPLTPIKPALDLHFLFGNHEGRITKYIETHPALEGFLSLDNCITPEGWQRHSFLEPVDLDGIIYSHYFYQPNTGKPYGGENVEGRIRMVGHSFVMGHQQGLRLAMPWIGGKRRVGVVAGSYYQHDEDYKGPQGNDHYRGIVVLNEVEDGGADVMTLSMDYLCRRYEGMSLAEFQYRRDSKKAKAA